MALFFLEGHRSPPVTSFNLNCLLKTLRLGLGLRRAALGQSSVCAACVRFTAGSFCLLYLECRLCGTGLCHSAMSSAHCRDRPPYPCDPPTALCGGPPQAPTLRASPWALPGSEAAELWVNTHGEPPQARFCDVAAGSISKSSDPNWPRAPATHRDVFLVREQEILSSFLKEGLWEERRGWVCGEDQPGR